MAAINELIAQIEDEGLRLKIEAEVKRLLNRKKFGLVFEHHLPEGLDEGPVYPSLQAMDQVAHADDKTLWHTLIEADNPCIGRAQLIRLVKTTTGTELKRLDFAAHSELREKMAWVSLNEELDNLFTMYGE